MSPSRPARAFPSKLLQNGALLLCLFAPSLWMIATIPPLWRDVDAYLQLTLHPLVTTFWGHAPAYSYLAKVPLFLGEQLERWRGIAGPAAESGLPRLTDTGVWLIIIGQHLALGGAAFYFIRSIGQAFWIRLALALAWATNSLFYTFAHCTGSESLSLILIILLVAKGLRLIRSRREPSWRDWYLLAIILCLCLLSRHANLWLILLLPSAFLFSSAVQRLATGGRPRRRLLAARHLRNGVIALAIGIACSGVANSWTHYVARKTRFHPHSRIGYSFLWRLQFLKNLPPSDRAALLQKVSDRTRSPDARQLLTLLGQVLDDETAALGGAFVQRAGPLMYPQEAPIPWERLDGVLNQMAVAFLWPPTSEHLHAAKTDLAVALTMSMPEIPNRLFNTTAYFFDHKDEMPDCAKLVTFRDTTAERINGIPSRYPYFHLWRGVNYHKGFVVWLGSLLLLAGFARGKRVNIGAIPAFGIALVSIGLLMAASACLLIGFLPRYALPMWQLLLLSLYIFIGASGDLLAAPRFNRAMR